MSYINELSAVVLILIRAGVVFRVAYSFLGMILSDEEAPAGKKRIKNILKFYIVAELVFVIKDTILYYYS